MRRRNSRVGLCLLLIALVLAAFFYQSRRSAGTVFIAVPAHKPLSEFATLQWEPREVELPPPGDDGLRHPGYTLALEHCATCHLLPEPGQLPRETWPFVMTWMSNYLGYTNTYVPFGNNVDWALFPGAPLVTEGQLQQMTEYFSIYAPPLESFVQRSGESRAPSRRFGAKAFPVSLPAGDLVTCIEFDEVGGRLFVGRGNRPRLQAFGREGEVVWNHYTDSEPVGVETTGTGLRIGLMGAFMEDRERGAIVDLTPGQQPALAKVPLLEGFHRLTGFQSIDLDQDGEKDLLVVGFGAGVRGRVSIFWSVEKEQMEERETVLLDHAGGLNAVVKDVDGDGDPDVILATSQQQQEILAFRNEGERRFDQQVLFKGPPGFGMNHIAMADMNRDGREDIVVTNGNNMEIKDAPLKPYHGVRILENRGELRFTERYFYPMFGALKTAVADFDRDGDLDLASIAFYPNWEAENPETFVYLENRGDEGFVGSGLPREDLGRWMCLDVADVNGDDFPDVLLGGAYIVQGVHSQQREWFSEWARSRPSLLYLENEGVADPESSEVER